MKYLFIALLAIGCCEKLHTVEKVTTIDQKQLEGIIVLEQIVNQSLEIFTEAHRDVERCMIEGKKDSVHYYNGRLFLAIAYKNWAEEKLDLLK